MPKFNKLVCIFLLFYCNITLSQDINSKDVDKSEYIELNNEFLVHIKDTASARIIAINFLNKAKKQNHITKISDGYYMLAQVSNDDIAFKYLDSIIELTTNANDYDYPGKAYLHKARILGSQGKFNESMDELIKVNSISIANKNIEQQFKTKYYIALLKNELGEFDESRKTLETVVSYNKMKYEKDKNYEYDYIRSLYAYGNSLNLNGYFDLAHKVNENAIRLSLQSKDSILYKRLLLTSAVSEYSREKYDASLDSINKLLRISNYSDLSIGTQIRIDLYLGKIYNKKKDFEKSISYLKSSDSLVFKNNYFFPRIRDSYELLIDNFKRKGNKDEQLFYINRLLYVDSILDKNYRYLSKQINNEYSKSNLLAEKQEIIDSLKKNNKSKIIILLVLSSLSFVLILSLIYNYRKKKIYKDIFLNLIADTNESNPQKTVNKSANQSEVVNIGTSDLGISQKIIDDILNCLDEFEEKEGYLKSNITVSSLSKSFNTNSKYLSKVINTFKDKNFSNYINDLRIKYAIAELKKNPKFRKFTIKAIAQETGFNTTEAFSKSFYKVSGIYPSFFLKQLEKQSEQSSKS